MIRATSPLRQLAFGVSVMLLSVSVAFTQLGPSDAGLRVLTNKASAILVLSAGTTATVWVYRAVPPPNSVPDNGTNWFQAQHVVSLGADHLYSVPGLGSQVLIRKAAASVGGVSSLMVYWRPLAAAAPCNLVSGTYTLLPAGSAIPVNPARPTFVQIGAHHPKGIVANQAAAEAAMTARPPQQQPSYENDNNYNDGGDEDDMSFKPIIYLYADAPTACYVRSTPATPFTALYPGVDAHGGWHVTTLPGGLLLHNTPDSVLYPSLFWEAPTAAAPAGPVPAWRWHRTQLAPALETRLDSLGLSPRERAEFIQFWLPRLAAHEWVSVSFGWQLSAPGAPPHTAPGWEGYFAANGLEITPTPAHTLRLMMAWQPAPVPGLAPPAAPLPHIARTGFYAVEWGGFQWPDAGVVRAGGE